MNPKELTATSPLTLEAVKTQFDHWRATRARGSRTPSHLWQAVQGLTEKYAYDQIGSTLNINPRRLRAKLEKQSHQPSTLLKAEFVEVPLSPLALSSSSSSSPKPKTFNSDAYAHTTLEFTRPDGLALKASG